MVHTDLQNQSEDWSFGHVPSCRQNHIAELWPLMKCG